MKQVPFEDRSKPKEVPAPVEQVKKDPKNKITYYQQLAGKYDTLNTLNGCVGSSGQLWEFTRSRIFESEE